MNSGIAMKVALAQVNTTVGDFAGNAAKIREFARRAQQGGGEMVVFPELCLCGYPPRDLVDKPSFLERNRQELEALARDLPDIRIICGFVSKVESETGRSAANKTMEANSARPIASPRSGPMTAPRSGRRSMRSSRTTQTRRSRGTRLITALIALQL